jgi:hypothetical protein
VAGTGRDVDILSRQIEAERPEALNNIHRKQSINVTRRPPDAFEIGAKTRAVLHGADRHKLCVAVDHPDELVQIDPPAAVGAEPQLDI